MDTGELWTRWTVRAAMALYAVSLALRIAARGRWPWLVASRLGWTAGCAAYLLHVGCAFEFYHHWSHADAYDFTARRTHEVVGIDWGGGVYVNYVFTLVWLADVCWWWGNSRSYVARSRLVEWAVQGVMGFVAFNATIVFATGFSQWVGVLECGVLAIAGAARARNRKRVKGRPHDSRGPTPS